MNQISSLSRFACETTYTALTLAVLIDFELLYASSSGRTRRKEPELFSGIYCNFRKPPEVSSSSLQDTKTFSAISEKN
jgi:hypothetical protein